MIFKSERKNYSVYDPKVDACIAEFIEGQFETADEVKIARLIELGYKPEDVVEEIKQDEPVAIPIVSETVDEIKPKRGRPKVIK